MKDHVKVAVIGTGWWATTTHIPALQADPQIEVSLCDRNPERAAAAAGAFGISRLYTDHRNLLETESPDAVVVATTHATHFSIAKDCLEAGAHLLVEKPLTLKAAEARQLVELARQKDRALLCGYPWNYSAPACRAREAVRSGRLGTVQFVNCVFNSYCADLLGGKDRSETGAYAVHGPGDVYSKREHSGGGHGHLQMTHAAGLLFFVTALPARVVRARMEHHGLALDLVDAMMVDFEGGGLGLVGGTSNAFLPRMELQVYGSEGSLLLDMHAGTARFRYADETQEEMEPSSDPSLRTAPTTQLIAIARNAEPPVIAEEAWRSVELLDAAYRSAEAEGRPVAIEELYLSVR